MEKETLYNIYIVGYKTDIAEALIGSNLNERQSERRVMSGLMRCNSDFGVYDVEVDSEQDKKYANQIALKNQKVC